MNAITFDTLASVRRLKAHGLAQEQAEELRVAHDSSRDELVTVGALDSRIARLEAKMAENKTEIIKWMFGGFVAILGVLMTILFKLH